MLQKLDNRYVFKGRIVMESALHVGGGDNEGHITDGPVLKGTDGSPFIPGASLKGAFRAAAERILNALDFKPCLLFEENEDCLTTNKKERKAFEENRKKMREQEIVLFLKEKLCPACLLFGSPFNAGRVRFADAHLLDDWVLTEVRDGVGIDRDSGRAVDRVKFNYEAVPAGSTFEFSLVAENLSSEELGMLSAGIQEMRGGYVPLGGLKTRGLGKCRLDLSCVEILEVMREGGTDLKALKQYLKSRKGTVYCEEIQMDNMLNNWIDHLFGGIKGA